MVIDISYIKCVLLDAFQMISVAFLHSKKKQQLQSYAQLAKAAPLYFILQIPCVFFNLIHQPTKALKKLQFIRSIKLLHVSPPGYHSRGVLEHGNIGPTH